MLKMGSRRKGGVQWWLEGREGKGHKKGKEKEVCVFQPNTAQHRKEKAPTDK